MKLNSIDFQCNWYSIRTHEVCQSCSQAPPFDSITPLRLVSTIFSRLARRRKVDSDAKYQAIKESSNNTWFGAQYFVILHLFFLVWVRRFAVRRWCQLTWPLQTVSLFKTHFPFIFPKNIPKQQSRSLTTWNMTQNCGLKMTHKNIFMIDHGHCQSQVTYALHLKSSRFRIST